MPKEKPPRRDFGVQCQPEQNFEELQMMNMKQNEAIQLLVNDLRAEKLLKK